MATNEQIPLEDIQNTDSYLEYKTKELLSFITDTLSKKNGYEEKDVSFKQHLQHTLFDEIKAYERNLKRVAEVYEQTSDTNTYLRDVARLDETIRRFIERKIDQHMTTDYQQPSSEEIEQRQREFIRDSKKMSNAYYRTPEGREFKAAEKERKSTAYLNRQDPLIRKMKQGEDISEELADE
jgi:hypothetical protein